MKHKKMNERRETLQEN